MEAMRDAWTDERLDDLANRMDRGFDRVDADIREQRAETKSELEALDSRLDAIQKTMAQAAIGMSAAFVAGFAALGGLIAAG
jgi:hypothetical protein